MGDRTTRLRDWRRVEGYSLPELAGLTGVSISMLSLAERGLRRLSPRAKVTIARRVGVPVGDLFPPDEEDEAASEVAVP